MLILGQGDPSGCVAGIGSLCCVHGQPVLPGSGAGRSLRVIGLISDYGEDVFGLVHDLRSATQKTTRSRRPLP